MCRTLLSAERAHISLPSSSLLSHRDVRHALHNMGSQGASRPTRGLVRTKQPGMVIFVDDLHFAPSGE